MTETRAPDNEVQRAIDREIELVISAIDLVASGGARSTMVAGLHLTEAVLQIVRPVAARRGVVVEQLWGSDETSNDVRVRLDPAS